MFVKHLAQPENTIILEMNEDFINKTLRVLYSKKQLLGEITGKVPIEGLRHIFQKDHFLEYKFKLLDAPTVDAIKEDILSINLNIASSLTFSALLLESNLDVKIYSKPEYDLKKETLDLNLNKIDIEDIILSDNFEIPKIVLDVINNTVKNELSKGLFNNLEKIQLLHIIPNITLPEVPNEPDNQMQVIFRGISVVDESIIALEINLERLKRKNYNKRIQDFSRKTSAAVSIPESEITQTIDFWWPRTTYAKKHEFSGKQKIQKLGNLLDFISEIGLETITRTLTLGFLELNFNVLDAWLLYSGEIGFGKPNIILENNRIDLRSRNQLSIKGSIIIDLESDIKLDTTGFIPDRLTPWEDEVYLRKNKALRRLFSFDQEKVSAEIKHSEIEITSDEKNRFIAQVKSIDLELNLESHLPRYLQKRLEKRIETEIIENLPSVPVFPALIDQKILGTDIEVEISVKEFDIFDGKIILYLDVDVD